MSDDEAIEVEMTEEEANAKLEAAQDEPEEIGEVADEDAEEVNNKLKQLFGGPPAPAPRAPCVSPLSTPVRVLPAANCVPLQ
jgi:hypothetical protein